jgi:hypothetical protein
MMLKLLSTLSPTQVLYYHVYYIAPVVNIFERRSQRTDPERGSKISSGQIWLIELILQRHQ